MASKTAMPAVFSRFAVEQGEHFEIAIRQFWCRHTAVRRLYGVGDDTIHALIRIVHDGQVHVEYVRYWTRIHNKPGPYTVVIPANIEIKSDAPMFISFFLLNEAHGTRESALEALNRMEGGIVAGAGNGANQGDQIQRELVARANLAVLAALPKDPIITLVTPLVLDRLAGTIRSLVTNRDGPVFYSSIMVNHPLHYAFQEEKGGVLHGGPMTHGARYDVEYFVKRQTQRLPIVN